MTTILMRDRTHKFVRLSLLPLLLVGCRKGPAATGTPSYDLSSREAAARAGLPGKSYSDRFGATTDAIINGRAVLRLPGDHLVDHGVSVISVIKDGDLARQIVVTFKDGPRDDVYALSKRMAANWGLPTEEIDEWYQAQQPRIERTLTSMRNDTSPSVEMLFKESYGLSKQYMLQLSFYWSDRPRPLATQQGNR
jgi:hypothetical protein